MQYFLGSANTDSAQGPGIEAVGPRGKVWLIVNWIEFLLHKRQE